MTASGMRPASSVPAFRSLSVVIPAYQEEGRLPSTLETIHGFLVERAYDAELIVVDDGSRDETPRLLSGLRPRYPLLRSLRLDPNHGKGYAVRAGILASTRDTILFTDADLSTPIGEIDKLWKELDRGFDVVIASRRAPGAELLIRQPLSRRFMGHVFSTIVSTLGVRGIRDTQCGFKMFRRSVARELFTPATTHGFAFDVEVLYRARKRRFRIAEVGVSWSDRPGSKVSPLRDSSRMLLDLLRMRRVL